jgi:hypothetical protein
MIRFMPWESSYTQLRRWDSRLIYWRNGHDDIARLSGLERDDFKQQEHQLPILSACCQHRYLSTMQ